MPIRNPLEWGLDQLRQANDMAGSMNRPVHTQAELGTAEPTIRHITVADIAHALALGVEDFKACRTDVVFLSVAYPVVGLILWRLATGYDLLPLIFPLSSGFALVGPFAAIGLYEMSRRREQRMPITIGDAFGVLRSPSLGEIVVLGLVLVALFLFWVVAAEEIYRVTLGPDEPSSVAGFVHDVLLTQAGWTLIVVGIAVGFLFAVVVLAISIVSFPLLLDRGVGIDTAVATSLRAVAMNPGPVALWGAIVAGSLVVGSIPLFVGLVVIMPILGHATWHLYRRLIV
ncbi:MAG: DUF2189 domain-containing protein [Alphaproteobacteria bacterium]|nr:DUF2189 domain-containing protein [Alphaproteobacteria bacterium]